MILWLMLLGVASAQILIKSPDNTTHVIASNGHYFISDTIIFEVTCLGKIACGAWCNATTQEGVTTSFNATYGRKFSLAGINMSIIGCGITHAAGLSGEIFANPMIKGEYRSGPCANGTSWPILPNITRLALGYRHGCALTQEGTVACWGSNDRCQLGSGLSNLTTSVMQVYTLYDDFINIAAQGIFTFAQRQNGDYVVWGAPAPIGGTPVNCSTYQYGRFYLPASDPEDIMFYAATDSAFSVTSGNGDVYFVGIYPEITNAGATPEVDDDPYGWTQYPITKIPEYASATNIDINGDSLNMQISPIMFAMDGGFYVQAQGDNDDDPTYLVPLSGGTSYEIGDEISSLLQISTTTVIMGQVATDIRVLKGEYDNPFSEEYLNELPDSASMRNIMYGDDGLCFANSFGIFCSNNASIIGGPNSCTILDDGNVLCSGDHGYGVVSYDGYVSGPAGHSTRFDTTSAMNITAFDDTTWTIYPGCNTPLCESNKGCVYSSSAPYQQPFHDDTCIVTETCASSDWRVVGTDTPACITKIVAGIVHSCYLGCDNNVYCAGDTTLCQYLAVGHVDSRLYNKVWMGSIAKAGNLYAGPYTTCILSTDTYSLTCTGQYGDASICLKSASATVVSADPILDVFMGMSSICYSTEPGDVYCSDSSSLLFTLRHSGTPPVRVVFLDYDNYTETTVLFINNETTINCTGPACDDVNYGINSNPVFSGDVIDPPNFPLNTSGYFPTTMCTLISGSINCSSPFAPMAVGQNITQVAVGFSHMLVLTGDGHLCCFGDNTYGQCGRLNTTLLAPLFVCDYRDWPLAPTVQTPDLTPTIPPSDISMEEYMWGIYGLMGLFFVALLITLLVCVKDYKCPSTRIYRRL